MLTPAEKRAVRMAAACDRLATHADRNGWYRYYAGYVIRGLTVLLETMGDTSDRFDYALRLTDRYGRLRAHIEAGQDPEVVRLKWGRPEL